METERSKAPITTKPAKVMQHSVGNAIKEDKGSLVKASRLPMFMQRKTVASSDDEKENKMIRKETARQQHAVMLLMHPDKKNN